MVKPNIDAKRIHMVGVGGAGVSGLALLMARLGYDVSGSDLRTEAVADRLQSAGVRLYAGHDASYVEDCDLVVASAAIPQDNPELVAAQANRIPVWSRAKMLGELMAGNFGIAVSGTHGKTTTTSMLASVLETAGRDPTVLVGGDLDMINGNSKLGDSDLFVAEACEAFNSFLELRPAIAVVTNIEADHLDYHLSLGGVIASFKQFLSQAKAGGCVIACIDCPNVSSVLPSVKSRVLTFGLTEDAQYRATNVELGSPATTFDVVLPSLKMPRFTLRVPGLHNVRNALAAIAVADALDVDPEYAREALGRFRGVRRRFEILGTVAGITVIDDYAHHPTEVRATLSAARTLHRRTIAVFQPHLYSRTQSLAGDFADALRDSDLVFVTEIYAAREKPIPGVSASLIVDIINATEPGKAQMVTEKSEVPDRLLPILEEGDVVLVMGAGDIRSAGESLLQRLSVR